MCQDNNSCQHGAHNSTAATEALQKLNTETVIEEVLSRTTTKEEASYTLTHLGALALESKNFESAQLLLNRALEQQENGFVHSNLGTLNMHKNNLEEAKRHWHIAADTYQLGSAQFSLARLYKQEKNNELAKKYYQLVAASKTQYTAVACFELAEIFAQEENTEQEAHYLHVASEEYDFPYAHSTLGLMYMDKDTGKAKEYLLKALARRHDWAWKNNEHILDEVHYNLGVLFEQQNNLKVAKKHYKRAAEHEHPGACWRLALILSDENGNNALVKKYLHVVADKYNVGLAQWQLGWMYTSDNNVEQAKFYWHKAADEHKNVRAAMSLSRLYHLLGDAANTQKYYDLAANNIQTQEEKDELEKLQTLLAQKEQETPAE